MGSCAWWVSDRLNSLIELNRDSEPDNTGSIGGALHRGWIDLKSALGGGDHAILAATETGEDRR